MKRFGALLFLLALPLAAQQPADKPADPAPDTVQEEGVATGVGNKFLQTWTPLTNEKGLFEASLTHRFLAAANEAGGGGALGLDNGNSFGVTFDYVPLKNVAVQVRRVDINADYEFAAKVTALRPTAKLPLSLGVRAGLDWQTANYVPEKRTAGFAQLLAAFTIGDRVTLSANPACVQKTPTYDDTVCNVPLAIQIKITKSIAAMAEYVPAKKKVVPDGVGQWSFAIEKSVFRHKFALWIGNSGATNVDQLLGGDWLGGVTESNIRLGFNLLRQFDINVD